MSLAYPSSVVVEAIAVITGTFLSGMSTRTNHTPERRLNSPLGAMMNLFLLTIPVLLDTTREPGQILHNWSRIYFSGHRKGPGISMATALLHSYAAWSKYSAGESWRICAIAGVATVTMIPYTWLFMISTNNLLFGAEMRSKNGNAGSLVEAKTLVKKWNRLNAVRALFPLTGAVLGILGVSDLLAF